MTRPARERAPEAEASLTAATRARVAREVSARADDAPRFGLSRAQALDLVLERAEADGASPAYARILRGAADVFGEVGVEGASVDLVLAASGVSRRTFYQFFEGKAQVLDALLAIIASIWRADVEKALAEAPRRETLVRVFVRAYRLAGFLLRVVFAEATRRGSPLVPRYDAMLDALTKITMSALAYPATRRKRTRAEIVAMLAVIEDAGIDPGSNADESRAVESLVASLFAEA